jgi:DNA-binding MarR family transcriptional regulator
MLTEAALAVLDALTTGREATPATLARETEYSQDHLYDVLDALLAEGLLTETRETHNQRRVRVTDHPVVEAYRHLGSSLNHVEWPAVLSPATLRVCWYLDEPRRVTTIADRLNITRQAVTTTLSPLKHRAMLAPAGPEYALVPDLHPLLNFARATAIHSHRSRVREIAPSATVEWCDPRRALVRVHTSDDTAALQSAAEWRLTGLARFRDYGLGFYLAGEPAFWYAPTEDVTPAEVVCHTLSLDSDARRASYAMLLIEKTGLDQSTVVETARWYDLAAEFAVLYRALEDDHATANETETAIELSIPSDTEYGALKEQYGVP